MILCEREILEALEQKRIYINPTPPRIFFDSTVVDLRLAARLDQWAFLTPDALGTKFRPAHPDFNYTAIEKAHTKGHDLATAGPFDLAPRGFVLGYTLEHIYLPHTSRICARVEGKSTLARLGLGVHVTAPTIHAGFGFNRLDPAKSGRRSG
jgi:dCTP deaminase